MQASRLARGKMVMHGQVRKKEISLNSPPSLSDIHIFVVDQ